MCVISECVISECVISVCECVSVSECLLTSHMCTGLVRPIPKLGMTNVAQANTQVHTQAKLNYDSP